MRAIISTVVFCRKTKQLTTEAYQATDQLEEIIMRKILDKLFCNKKSGIFIPDWFIV